MRKKTSFLVYAAMIAAIYAALTVATWQFSSLAIQFRLSEAMCILPAITPAAIPGLTIGCAFANLFQGNLPDALFGSLATLLSALLTSLLAKVFKGKLSFTYPIPAVILNTLAVPFILYYGYGFTTFGNVSGTVSVLAIYALSVFIGQSVVCMGLGLPLYHYLQRMHKHLFKSDRK